MSLIDPDMVLEAAQDLLDLYTPETKIGKLDLAKIVEDNAHVILLEIGRGLGAIGAAWKNEVGMVFHHGGILNADALYYLLAGCYGHGISLADSHAECLEQAEGVLGSLIPVVFEPTPCNLDDCWLNEIMMEFEDTSE